jgi:hypothetical protein
MVFPNQQDFVQLFNAPATFEIELAKLGQENKKALR